MLDWAYSLTASEITREQRNRRWYAIVLSQTLPFSFRLFLPSTFKIISLQCITSYIQLLPFYLWRRSSYIASLIGPSVVNCISKRWFSFCAITLAPANIVHSSYYNQLNWRICYFNVFDLKKKTKTKKTLQFFII